MRSKHNETAQALQSCLELVRSGKSSIAAVLEDYPELKDVLKPELETALWLRERSSLFAPRAGYVHASESRVVSRIHREAGRVAPSVGRGGASYPFWSKEFWQRKAVFQTALALLLVISLLIGTSGVAKASQPALPGDSLYPVKIFLENVSISLAPSMVARAELRIRYSQRRLTEVQSLVAAKRYSQISQTESDFAKQLDQALKEIHLVAAHDKIQGESLATSLLLALSSQVERITLLEDIVPQQAKPDFELILNISADGIAAAQAVLSAGGQTAGLSTPAGASATLPVTPQATPSPSVTATMTAEPTATPDPVAGLISGIPTETAVPTSALYHGAPTQTMTPSPTSAPDNNHNPNRDRKPTRTPKPKPTHDPKPTDDQRYKK